MNEEQLANTWFQEQFRVTGEDVAGHIPADQLTPDVVISIGEDCWSILQEYDFGRALKEAVQNWKEDQELERFNQ